MSKIAFFEIREDKVCADGFEVDRLERIQRRRERLREMFKDSRAGAVSETWEDLGCEPDEAERLKQEKIEKVRALKELRKAKSHFKTVSTDESGEVITKDLSTKVKTHGTNVMPFRVRLPVNKRGDYYKKSVGVLLDVLIGYVKPLNGEIEEAHIFHYGDKISLSTERDEWQWKGEQLDYNHAVAKLVEEFEKVNDEIVEIVKDEPESSSSTTKGFSM